MEPKKYKVLVKGPWEGVKEDFWEIDEETLEKFGDEENTVRVVCVYEKGEPQYNFVRERTWENFEKIGEIVSNPNFSSGQKTAEIKKLLAE